MNKTGASGVYRVDGAGRAPSPKAAFRNLSGIDVTTTGPYVVSPSASRYVAEAMLVGEATGVLTNTGGTTSVISADGGRRASGIALAESCSCRPRPLGREVPRVRRRDERPNVFGLHER
jgi:hypothetical protein